MLSRARLSVDDEGKAYRDRISVAVSDNGYGYLKCRAGDFTFKVHQVAAEQFFGGPSLALFPTLRRVIHGRQWDVAHKNRRKHDNRRCNLMYVPHSFNMVHESPCPLIGAEKRRQAARANYEKQKQVMAMGHPCGRPSCRTAVSINRWIGSRKCQGHKRQQMLGNTYAPRKLTPADVDEIRYWAGRVSKRSLGKRFGVSATHIDRVVKGRRTDR